MRSKLEFLFYYNDFGLENGTGNPFFGLNSCNLWLIVFPFSFCQKVQSGPIWFDHKYNSTCDERII